MNESLPLYQGIIVPTFGPILNFENETAKVNRNLEGDNSGFDNNSRSSEDIPPFEVRPNHNSDIRDV